MLYVDPAVPYFTKIELQLLISRSRKNPHTLAHPYHTDDTEWGYMAQKVFVSFNQLHAANLFFRS
jgi:hypothetical protein